MATGVTMGRSNSEARASRKFQRAADKNSSSNSIAARVGHHGRNRRPFLARKYEKPAIVSRKNEE
jgi:hypothetical protein